MQKSARKQGRNVQRESPAIALHLEPGARQNKSVYLDRSSRRFYFLILPPKRLLKVWRLSHVHVWTADFVSRRRSAGSLFSPVSTQEVFTNRFAHEVHGAVRSFFGGFSSTAGYVPGNEARHNSEEFASGVALIWLIISKERCSFLSEQLGMSFDSPSKPFGFDSGRFRRRLSAPSIRELRVTASAPPPGAGQNARKQSRLWSYLTPLIFDVK